MTKEEWLSRSINKTCPFIPVSDGVREDNPLEIGDHVRLARFERGYRDWYKDYMGKTFEVVLRREPSPPRLRFMEVETREMVLPGQGWHYAYFELVKEKETA